MLSFLFKKKKPLAQDQQKPLCYVGVASSGYTDNYDIDSLLKGNSDARFQKNKTHFYLLTGNKIFKSFNEALKHTSHRVVMENSAFVIGINCPEDKIDSLLENGNFSSAIIEVTNASTGKKYNINADRALIAKESTSNTPRSASANAKSL
jgi:hypothetical protein